MISSYRLLTDIDAAVNTLGRLIPIRLPRRDVEPIAPAAVAVFDSEGIAMQDQCYSMKWDTVPGHGLPGGEAQPTH